MHLPEFIFDHPSGLRISRGLREAEVSTLEGVGRRDMGTGYVWYSLPSRNSESDNKAAHNNPLPSVESEFFSGMLFAAISVVLPA